MRSSSSRRIVFFGVILGVFGFIIDLFDLNALKTFANALLLAYAGVGSQFFINLADNSYPDMANPGLRQGGGGDGRGGGDGQGEDGVHGQAGQRGQDRESADGLAGICRTNGLLANSSHIL